MSRALARLFGRPSLADAIRANTRTVQRLTETLRGLTDSMAAGSPGRR